jgi:hypothetical protein
MNAIASAWNMGEAPWAYATGGSAAVEIWARAYAATGDLEIATDAVVTAARACGIDPKRHKVHA